MAVNGVYRFLYFFLMKKIPIKDVPSGLEEYVFDLDGVELGKYGLQLPPPSDVKVSPVDSDDTTKNELEMHPVDCAEKKSKAYYTVDLTAIEFQPLIQRIEGIESQMKAFQSINIEKRDGTDSSAMEQQALVQRMENIENQNSEMYQKMQSMDFKFDRVEVQLKGILEALNQTPE
jgi:hypothetical protein